MNRQRSLALLALMALAGAVPAQLRLPALFGEHMVLQRQTSAPVWGWDEPGQAVTVEASWSPAAQTTQAGVDGRWQVELVTNGATGPQTLIIEGSSRVQINDVLLGEVWIASGQSNMEWPLWASEDGPERVAAARHPGLRIFDVARAIARQPQDDCAGAWQVVTPQSIEAFSAVAYHFGRELHTRLETPVGLIGSNWGGTVVESWTSAAALTALGEYSDELARIEDERRDPEAAAARSAAELAAWWEQLDEVDPGTGTGVGWSGWPWPSLEIRGDSGGWWSSEQPGPWSERGLEDFDGVVWMRRRVEIPAHWAGRPLQLELGPIDDIDTTWFGAEQVGGHETMGYWSTPRVYTVPGRLVEAGPTVITVRVVDTGGPGGFLGPAELLRLGPEGADPDEVISLSGSWWLRRGASMEDLGPVPASTGWFDQNRPTALFNGMIAPLVPYAVRGVIFYQGESNVGRAEQYARLFPAMIESWRAAWGGAKLPFYYVQIAPFPYGGEGRGAAELREAQRLSLATPDTGMAVTLDIGNPADIHPLNKHDVGHRLALWAAARTYGDDELVYSGPLYRASRVRGASLVLEFDHAVGLHARGEPPSHFEIGGADGIFYPALAEIVGQTVVLSSPSVEAPTMARFAWSDVAEPNLFNGAGLPASSFQTQWTSP